MPDLKPIGDFIGQVGFPIFIALVFVYQVFKMDAANRAVLDKQNASLDAILYKLDQLINRK